MKSFHEALRQNGIDYSLRSERLAYYCYHYYFFYINEVLETYFDLGGKTGALYEYLRGNFGGWIEENLRYAEEHF